MAIASPHALTERARGELGWKLGEAWGHEVRLPQRGFDIGTPDGIIGPRTVAAIKEFQKSLGLPPDGFPTVGLLGRL